MSGALERAAMWNHNTHYHDLLLRRLPRVPITRALDVGCGLGDFAAKVTGLVEHVDAIDVDVAIIARAAARHRAANLRFASADFLHAPLPEASYDFISAIASLHHMDMPAALAKMRRLLRPGGVIAVLGVYRQRSLSDHALSVIAFPISRLRRACNPADTSGTPAVRICDATLTFGEISSIAHEVLPGAELRRWLFWRYTLVWEAPATA